MGPEVSGVEIDKPREACGNFGIYAPGENLAELTCLGLLAEQHRGQEAAGIAVADGENITIVKDTGLVSEVFKGGQRLGGLGGGRLAIGHVRYGTTHIGAGFNEAQPHYLDGVALGHNGNLTNFAELCEEEGLNAAQLASDSDLMAHIIAREFEAHGEDLEPALLKSVLRFKGAFSLVIATADRLAAVRDPNGFRPLTLGRFKDGWVVASEKAALDIVGAQTIREVAPGEIIIVDEQGITSRTPNQAEKTSLCAFEFIYFARPDSELEGESVKSARWNMGRQLARQQPVEADLVIGVPESGVQAAMGYSHESGIPYDQGLVKNHYVGRSFIAATQDQREQAVRIKLNPLVEVIKDRSLIVVDDSIIRGTTTRMLVRMLREAGAREVHLRISSAPYRWPCFYGMDTGRRDELLAASKSPEEIRRHVGADSLDFLTIDNLFEALGSAATKVCTACMSGDYPTEVPVSVS